MASARVINYISCKRLASMRSLKIGCAFPSFYGKTDFAQTASYCTKKSISKTNKTNPVEYDNKMQVGFAEVVKENTKSAGYLGVIIGGIGITAFMFYVIFDELFSSKSSNTVYSKALERCAKHPQVIHALGEPIKAYGEESRRGRRTHISHINFVKDGVRHMRMKFYIQGIRNRGTVNLEMQENESGEYIYRYLYVLIDDIMQTVIKIEDIRVPNSSYSNEAEFDLS